MVISSPAPTDALAPGSVLMTWSGGIDESGFCRVRVLKPRFCSAAMASADTSPRMSGTWTSRAPPPKVLNAMTTTIVRTASTATATTQRPTDPPMSSRSTRSRFWRGSGSLRGPPTAGTRSRQQRGSFGIGEHLGCVGCLAVVHPDQIGPHLRRGLIPIVRILGQRFQNDSVQIRGDARMPFRRWDRVFAHMLVGDRDRRVTAERWFTGEDFVENTAQRIDIGASVDGFTASLLGR